jgi:hypothetical protein
MLKIDQIQNENYNLTLNRNQWLKRIKSRRNLARYNE